jgi:hypothetical protein
VALLIAIMFEPHVEQGVHPSCINVSGKRGCAALIIALHGGHAPRASARLSVGRSVFGKEQTTSKRMGTIRVRGLYL